jgi:hypothetical protein
MQRYKLSTPPSSSTAACPTGPPDWPPCRRLRPRHLPSQSLPRSPPLPLFSPFTASSASSATKCSALHIPTSTVGSSTSELPSSPNSARSEANHDLFSLVCVTVELGRQQCFFEEDIGVIWPCSVMVIIIHDALKLLLDAYLHRRE